MPLDPSIPLSVRPPQIDTPQEAQAKALQVRANAIALQQQQRTLAFHDALSRRLASTAPVAENGAQLYDVDAVTRGLASDGFGDSALEVGQHLSALNDSFRAVQVAKLGAVRQSAQSLLAAGASPLLADHLVDQLKSNQIIDDATAQQYHDAIQADPSNATKIAQYFAGPQKMENAAPGSMARNPLTGEVVPGSAVPESPKVVGNTLVQNGQPIYTAPQSPAQVEAARHNGAMERIAQMNAGREAAGQAETARHNRAMEAANNPFAALSTTAPGGPPVAPGGPQAGASGAGRVPVSPAPGAAQTPAQAPTQAPDIAPASIPPGGTLPGWTDATGPHGAAFLQSLNPQLANEVKAYVEGRRPFPAGFALKSPYFQALIQAAGQYDPSFDASKYNARNATRKDFTSPNGTAGKAVTSLNRISGHLDELSKAADALNNAEGAVGGVIPAQYWNQAANAIATKYGWSGATDFNTVAPRVADEIERLWRGTGGSSAEIEQTLGNLNTSMTPGQLRSAIAKTVNLVQSQFESLRAQRDKALGPYGGDILLETPQTQAIFNRLGGAAPQGAPPTDRLRVIGPNGETGTVPKGTALPAGWKVAQ